MASNALTSVNFLAPVQDLLPRVEALMRSQADDHHADLNVALNHLLSSGGKRVRPALALLTGQMLGAAPDTLVLLGATVELLHTATLVHDDLIDGAFLRRGIATLNSQWSPAATVLTGDFIFARAAKLAAEIGSLTVMRMFAETLATIVNGEITQLFQARGLASRENYDRRIYAKTASLFEMTTSAAALVSQADAAVVETVRCYGYSIGMAFQIMDDILDFTGEQATVGKPVASDLRQGLVTLPALYYLEAHPEDEDIRCVLSGRVTEDYDACIERLVASIRESGAIRRALGDAQEYVDQGIGALADLPENTERRALEEMARYFVNRRL